MARPMILVQEEFLSYLWRKYSIGVPINTLIKQEELNITSPTLTKLLHALDMIELTPMPMDDEIYNRIYDSLFPAWLVSMEEVYTVMSQPKGWVYTGNFPLGKWTNENNGDSNE